MSTLNDAKHIKKKYCIHCGKEISFTANFCEHCGNKAIKDSGITKEEFIKHLNVLHEEGIINYASMGGDLNFYLDDQNNVSPVSFLIQKNRIELAKKLTSYGASLDYGLPLLELTTLDDYTLEDVKYFVENGANVNEIGVKDFFPLWNVAFDNRLDIAKYLYSRGANIHLKTQHGRNVIFNAVMNKYKFDPHFLKWLIEVGVDPYLEDVNGNTFMTNFENPLRQGTEANFVLRFCGGFELVNRRISKEEFILRLSNLINKKL